MRDSPLCKGGSGGISKNTTTWQRIELSLVPRIVGWFRRERHLLQRFRHAVSLTVPLFSALLLTGLIVSACGVVNLGKWKGIEKTSPDENYYLVKKISLTAGSGGQPRYLYDHAMQESVNLVFQPASEKNVYTAKTIWIDPAGQEFRTIRQTYEKRLEEKEGSDRPKGGATRVHTMPTRELFEHKPGLWKVELYLDDVLVRRFGFEVR